MRRVARIIGDRADAKIKCGHFYGNDAHDLEFLRFIRALRELYVYDHGLVSLEGLRHLSDQATSIEMGPTWKQVSLRPLGRFRGLRTLYLDGQRRDIAVIGELLSLEDLTLRSVTLPDLSILLPLANLRYLDIKLGGTKDLRLLSRIGRLEYLKLCVHRLVWSTSTRSAMSSRSSRCSSNTSSASRTCHRSDGLTG